MKRSTLLFNLGLMCTFCTSAWAIPGNTLQKERNWLLNHDFFPAKSFSNSLELYSSTNVSRDLTEGRTLSFKGYTYTEGSEQILYESIALFKNTLFPNAGSSSLTCNEMFLIGSGGLGYFASSSSAPEQDFNKVWPECTKDTKINFLDRSDEATEKSLKLVYGGSSPIPADYKNAKMIHKGHQRFFMGYDLERNQPMRSKLTIPAIEFRVYRGKLYDYLATSNTLVVVYTGKKGDWNNWDKLQAYWNQEQSLFNKMQSETEKSKAFDL